MVTMLSYFLSMGIAAAETPRAVTVDCTATYQTIDHFGASDCWSMQKIGAWSDASKNKVADLLFSTTEGISLSCWRFNLGGGVNQDRIRHPWRSVETFEIGQGVYDWTRQANERWFLRAAKARGVPHFLAFVNSPPARMTRSGFTNGNTDAGSTNLREGCEPQFARYLADILKHFRDYPDEAERIAFDYISPVNEPQVAWNEREGQEGCRASNADLKRIIIALDEELKRQGVRARICTPESNTLHALIAAEPLMSSRYKTRYGNYIDALCGDPEVSGRLGRTLSTHEYSSWLLDGAFISMRKRVREKLDQYPGWKLWQSECCVMQGPHGEGGGGRDLTMTTALWVARTLHYDLTLLHVSAWHWWTAVSRENYKDGLIYTDYHNPGDPETIFPAKLLWAFGNYSRFIRPGMVRVKLDGADDMNGVMGSAYTDAQRRQLVIVFVNVSDAPVPISISYNGVKLSSLTPFVTSDAPGEDLKPYPSVAVSDAYAVPGKSVVTLVADWQRP